MTGTLYSLGMAPPGGKVSSPEVETDAKSEIKDDPDSIPIITSVNTVRKVSHTQAKN